MKQLYFRDPDGYGICFSIRYERWRQYYSWQLSTPVESGPVEAAEKLSELAEISS